MIRLFKVLWRRQKRMIQGILNLQNWILMTFVYVVAVTPVAIVLKLIRSPMLDKSLPQPGRKSSWHPRTDGPMTWDRIKKRS